MTISIPMSDYQPCPYDDGTPITKEFIDKLKSQLTETKCSWWTLPETIQKFIENNLIPQQDTWTLECFKSKDGIWHFDIPEFLTYQESLTNGTELSLDYWFEELSGCSPITGEKITLTISQKPMDDYTTTCSHSHQDPTWTESNYYFDNGSGILIWLCPYLQSLYKCIPQKLWLKIETPEYLPSQTPQG